MTATSSRPVPKKRTQSPRPKTPKYENFNLSQRESRTLTAELAKIYTRKHPSIVGVGFRSASNPNSKLKAPRIVFFADENLLPPGHSIKQILPASLLPSQYIVDPTPESGGMQAIETELVIVGRDHEETTVHVDFKNENLPGDATKKSARKTRFAARNLSPQLVQPGRLILGNENETGTIGFLVEMTEQPGPAAAPVKRLGILSAAHVMAGKKYSLGDGSGQKPDLVMQPADDPALPLEKVGRLKIVKTTTTRDYAVAKKIGTRTFNAKIHWGAEPPLPLGDVKTGLATGDLVWKSGMSTGVTSAPVYASDVVWRIGPDPVTDKDLLFSIVTVTGAAASGFATAGDSGAPVGVKETVVAADGTEVVKFRPVGIIVKVKMSGLKKVCVIPDLKTILKDHNLKLWPDHVTVYMPDE